MADGNRTPLVPLVTDAYSCAYAERDGEIWVHHPRTPNWWAGPDGRIECLCGASMFTLRALSGEVESTCTACGRTDGVGVDEPPLNFVPAEVREAIEQARRNQV